MAWPAIIGAALRALGASSGRAAAATATRTAATRGAAAMGATVVAPPVAAAVAPATISSTRAMAFSQLLANQQAATAAATGPVVNPTPPPLPGQTNTPAAPSGAPTPIAMLRGSYQGATGAMAMAGQTHDALSRFTTALNSARASIDGLGASASRSAESLRPFSASASNETAFLERGRLIRQFERGAEVGPSAAAAARAADAYEQRASPIKNLFEVLGNVIVASTARSFDWLIAKLNLDQIAAKAIEYLNRLPGIKIVPNPANPGGHVLPWLNMLNQLAALQPLGAAAGPPLFVPPINP